MYICVHPEGHVINHKEPPAHDDVRKSMLVIAVEADTTNVVAKIIKNTIPENLPNNNMLGWVLRGTKECGRSIVIVPNEEGDNLIRVRLVVSKYMPNTTAPASASAEASADTVQQAFEKAYAELTAWLT